jgi:alpha-L-fucosidase 2
MHDSNRFTKVLFGISDQDVYPGILRNGSGGLNTNIQLISIDMRKINAFLFLLLVQGVFGSCQMQEEPQPFIPQYKAIFNAPPQKTPSSKTPDAPLAGNGDIGITMGGKPDKLTFYLGKNDFWRAFPVQPGGGIALPGGLDLVIPALKDASYYAEQLPGEACIKAEFLKDGLKVNLKAWVAATANLIVLEMNSSLECQMILKLWATQGNTSITSEGSDPVPWVIRSFENTPYLEWPCHVAMAMHVAGEAINNEQVVRLKPEEKVFLTVSVFTSHDAVNWKEKAISQAEMMTTHAIDSIYREHEVWWKDFWAQSHIETGDSLIEKYYYTSQYLLASTTRAGKFAPGIWGCFITRDSMSWGGDYHLNYNFQAPYWALFSSNHIALTDNFDQPLLDYMEMGNIHAQKQLEVDGIYYPVGLGPKGLCMARWPLTPAEMEKRYGTRENTIDGGYKFLGQKINAVFSAGNMLMRFYSTRDTAYADRIYPYMLGCADFWEDYLKFENGRYVIYMDHFNEVMPNLRNKGIWRDRLGDFNSTLSLGLVKMLFKGMIDVSSFLERDLNRQEKWKHIVDHLSSFPVGEENGRMSLKNMERGPGNREVPAVGLNRVSIHGLILPGGVCGPVTDPDFDKILLEDVTHWRDRAKDPAEWGNTLGNGIETCFPAAVRVGYNSDSILYFLKARIARQSYPNLWITQSGGGIETLSAVPSTINEMLMQSYEGLLRIFPNWNHQKDASFYQLRAYGAFLVSSRLRNGAIESVHLVSEKGSTCKIQNPWPGKQVQLTRNGKKSELLSGEILNFITEINENIDLYMSSSTLLRTPG